MGEEKLVALLQESLSTAARTGAAKPSDLSKVIVDPTVQEKSERFFRPTRSCNVTHASSEAANALTFKVGPSVGASHT